MLNNIIVSLDSICSATDVFTGGGGGRKTQDPLGWRRNVRGCGSIVLQLGFWKNTLMDPDGLKLTEGLCSVHLSVVLHFHLCKIYFLQAIY